MTSEGKTINQGETGILGIEHNIDYDIVIKKRCEACGAVFIMEYGYSIGASWLVTGYHEGVPQFDCGVQHWGCTPEHAMAALIACLQHDEHLSMDRLRSMHKQAIEDGHPKVAPYFEKLYKEKGDNFYILVPGKDIDGDSTNKVRSTDTVNG